MKVNNDKIKQVNNYFAKVNNATLFSGFDLVLALHTKLTASCCACNRVGTKSPFLIKSLLSTLKMQKIVRVKIYANNTKNKNSKHNYDT